MKLIIEIPEGMLDELNTCKFPIQDAYRLCSIIENGKPLPKGHGRLIDADMFLSRNAYFANKDFIDSKYCDTLKDLIDNAPTIIEAEQEEEE